MEDSEISAGNFQMVGNTVTIKVFDDLQNDLSISDNPKPFHSIK
jgi:hypothetical protein